MRLRALVTLTDGKTTIRRGEHYRTDSPDEAASLIGSGSAVLDEEPAAPVAREAFCVVETTPAPTPQAEAPSRKRGRK